VVGSFLVAWFVFTPPTMAGPGETPHLFTELPQPPLLRILCPSFAFSVTPPLPSLLPFFCPSLTASRATHYWLKALSRA
jgi:hypothetical protein